MKRLKFSMPNFFFYWHWEWLQLFMKFNIVHTVIKYVTVAQFDFHNSNYSEDKQNKPQQNNLPSFWINNFSSKHTSLNRIWLICKLTFNWTHYLYKKNNIHLLNKYLKIDIGKLIWLDDKNFGQKCFRTHNQIHYSAPFLAASKYWLVGNRKYMFLLIAFILVVLHVHRNKMRLHSCIKYICTLKILIVLICLLFIFIMWKKKI